MLGRDVIRDREAVQRRLGYLPDDFVPYPYLTPPSTYGTSGTAVLPVFDRRDITVH